MSTALKDDPLRLIAARMEQQRAQLRQQFAPPPAPPGSTAMQPYQPRSLLMKLLVGNPQLLTRLLVLAVSGAVGARTAPWLLRIFGVVSALRKLRR